MEAASDYIHVIPYFSAFSSSCYSIFLILEQAVICQQVRQSGENVAVSMCLPWWMRWTAGRELLFLFTHPSFAFNESHHFSLWTHFFHWTCLFHIPALGTECFSSSLEAAPYQSGPKAFLSPKTRKNAVSFAFRKKHETTQNECASAAHPAHHPSFSPFPSLPSLPIQLLLTCFRLMYSGACSPISALTSLSIPPPFPPISSLFWSFCIIQDVSSRRSLGLTTYHWYALVRKPNLVSALRIFINYVCSSSPSVST